MVDWGNNCVTRPPSIYDACHSKNKSISQFMAHQKASQRKRITTRVEGTLFLVGDPIDATLSDFNRPPTIQIGSKDVAVNHSLFMTFPQLFQIRYP